MSIYTRGRAVADRQLADKGQLGAVRRTTFAGGGPASATAATVTVTDYPCRMAVFPINLRDVDGTLVKAGDYRVLVSTAGLSITPTTSDKLVTAQGVLTIVDAGRFDPAGVVTHYKMVARK